MSNQRLAMLRKPASNAEWIAWGERDPMWAVATEPGRRVDGSNPWTPSAFYESGRCDWLDFYKHWNLYGLRDRCCLELGCGAGRITESLVKTFGSVIAADVSPGMIAASKHALLSTNLTYTVLTDASLPFPDGTASAVFSSHVFQHLDDSHTILALFGEIFRVLEPDGSFMVHVPLTIWPNPPALGTVMELLSRPIRGLSGAIATIKRCARIPMMRMTSIEIEQLQKGLSDIGFYNVEFKIFPTSRNQHLHAFAFGRKPSNVR